MIIAASAAGFVFIAANAAFLNSKYSRCFIKKQKKKLTFVSLFALHPLLKKKRVKKEAYAFVSLFVVLFGFY